ncbi:MAG: PEGA domain-containing protein, partial [Victivallaceae bacterium]
AAVLIDSKPGAAAVKIGSRTYGNTPVVLNSLPAGEYVAKLTKPGFEELTLRFEVRDMRPQRLLGVFDSDLGKLQINSSPAGAYIFIDGKSVGVTPYETDLKSGRYRVKVSRDGYGDKEAVLEVKTEKLTDLTEMPVEVNIATEPTGADIIINEKNYGKAPLKVALIPGKYNLLASKDGFAAVKQVVELAPGHKLDLELNLKNYLGSIEMEATPAGVELYVDGKKYKELDRNKKLTISDLGPGLHRLEFRHPKAQPDSIVVNGRVRSGEVTFLEPVNMWIPNVELKFKSGELLRGVIVRADEKTIYFSDKPGITVRYPKKDIEAVREIK